MFTTEAIPSVTDPTALTSYEAAGSTGQVTNVAEEARADEAGGDHQQQQEGQNGGEHAEVSLFVNFSLRQNVIRKTL